jgi:hypothetical protein
LFSAVSLLETCSTRTCEIRGIPEIVASDPAGLPTRTGAFIAKNAAETIKKLWMYRCFTASSFNCVHRCVQQSCSSCRQSRHEYATIGGFETPRRGRFPDDIERHRNPAVFTRRNTGAMLKLLFSGFLPVL